MDNTQKSEKGFLSTLWKTHMNIAKYVGVFGIPAMFGFLPKAAVTAHLNHPDAGILDIFTTLWGMMGSRIGEFAIPGWSVIFGALGDTVVSTFNAVASVAAPQALIPIPAPLK